MSLPRWITKDTISGTASLIIAGIGWYRIRNIPLQRLEAGLGPAFFPMAVVSLLTLLAAILIIIGVTKGLKSSGTGSQTTIKPGLHMYMIALFIFYAIAFRHIGLLPSSAVFLFITLIVLKIKLKYSFLITAVSMAAFYLIFGIMFRIHMF